MTKAKTIQARRKFKKRWPCQKLRISVGGAAAAAAAEVLLVSFHWSMNSVSFTPTTLRAVDPQISQVLKIIIIKIINKHDRNFFHMMIMKQEDNVHEYETKRG